MLRSQVPTPSGGQVPGGTVLERLLLAASDRHVERVRHLARDVGLDLEHVGERGVERLLPLGVGAAHLDQLGTHLQIDPTFASLRSNPRFERLVAGK
jgi:hypothetical protein